MNAAARLVHQGSLSRHLVLTQLGRQQLFALFLSFAVLFSAIGIIYASYSLRVLYSRYQSNLVEQNHLQVERAQLLLERGTLMMQTRIQHIAEDQLKMMMPNQKSVVIIHQ